MTSISVRTAFLQSSKISTSLQNDASILQACGKNKAVLAMLLYVFCSEMAVQLLPCGILTFTMPIIHSFFTDVK